MSVRSMWSGTITFGLVSIPVDLLAAVRPRLTAMKLVDKSGHPLGREYHCSKEDRKLSNDELVRGYETDSGKIIEITDEELESVAPEKSGDIELSSFVPLEQIPPMYFHKPYFLAPAGKSTKAYHLLAAIMERTGRVGIGSFVMRDHEYLVAIVSDNGVLRADTLRYADEIRQPKSIGLSKPGKGAARKGAQFAKQIDELTRRNLDTSELADEEAATLEELVQAKLKADEQVIHVSGLEDAGGETEGAKVIDLMDLLRKSLSKKAVVTNAEGGSVVSLADRRQQLAAAKKNESKRSAAPRKKSKPSRRARS
jgi:DNA end-binding protein Ku